MTCDIAKLSAEAAVRIQLSSILPGVKNSSEIEHVPVTQSPLTPACRQLSQCSPSPCAFGYMLSLR